MKCTLVLFGLLALVVPAVSQAYRQDIHSRQQVCGQDIQSNPKTIPCPGGTTGICVIPLSCLQELESQKDPAAIEVNPGDIVYWIGNITDDNGNFRQFHFKAKFIRIKNSDNPDCSDSKPDEKPFEDGFPDPSTQTPSLKKTAVVNVKAPYHGCFKHVIHLDSADGKDNDKDDDGKSDIDPHIMIGGPSLSSVFGVDTTSTYRQSIAQPKLALPKGSAASTNPRQ
jgi:hypothetical protein